MIAVKKILLIEASPRKGFSTQVSKQIENTLSGNAEVQVIRVRELEILPCKGCALCLSRGSAHCPHDSDDVRKVLAAMEHAEGVILVTPNYSLQVPGNLKILFDRLAFVFHRPRLFGKTFMPVVVQGVYGGRKIARYLNEVFSFWGMQTINGLVIAGGVFTEKAQSAEWEKENQAKLEKELQKILNKLEGNPFPSPGLLKLLLFRITRTSLRYSGEALEADRGYFEKKGWFQMPYYYPVRLNPFYRLAGSAADSLIKRTLLKS